MSDQAEMNSKKPLTVGILAHVDAGKTTLSEAILYLTGRIAQLGRVDRQDAYLDTNQIERERGITIFSKQAVFPLGDRAVTLLDTPGHVDFSAETERTLQVLDYAVLVISAADGVQGHTLTLWRLLKHYQIPVFLFLNKMDQPGTDRKQLLEQLQEKLHENCIAFDGDEESFFETLAVCDETLLETYLAEKTIPDETVREQIRARKVFPCYFGSALKLTGVESFLAGFLRYTEVPAYAKEFRAKVFKIARDGQNNRLTYLKVTGGMLSVRQQINEEKVSQLRIYSGERFEAVNDAAAGTVCAVTGLSTTFAGQGLGEEPDAEIPLLEPVLTYALELPEDCNPAGFLPKMRTLEEEQPELKVVWLEETGQIQLQMMGEVQIQIVKRLIWDRFHVPADLGEGQIIYKETIRRPVEGVGHYEPLRHYAEVHLLLEPGEPGSGVQIMSACSEDRLDKNWQRLILTHLGEKEHTGVLTGGAITDIRITLLDGKAHLKHTEGGDFRQATYRAVRHGLMKAENVLLEPYYHFTLEVPTEYIGRAITDIEKMHGSFTAPEQQGGSSVLKGTAPVAQMRNYQQEISSYTKGMGRLFCTLQGYQPCHNTEEVLASNTYDPELDAQNPPGSVFCSHGAGFYVPWQEVEEYMHLPLSMKQQDTGQQDSPEGQGGYRQPAFKAQTEDYFMGEEEVLALLEKTGSANRKGQAARPVRKLQKRVVAAPHSPREKKSREKYLLVDGYNIIFAWKELNELAKMNIDAARGRLMDIMCNYQAYRQCTLILVFDAYQVKGNVGQMLHYHNIHVVYTKEAETADQYIEKLAYRMGGEFDVTVATSDGLEQLIIRGQGCRLISAREFKEEVRAVEEQIQRLL
ncbi:MAG: TetM/TetW/TetO/TetS family tetracycline resistance ribosomal protection protein [Clostridiaceae bacterium]|nr:TetM/TetW/TetO/TetS family tetracycline resistance ribosomal protection protein [Clostridiaceae bacterium]